MIPIKINFNEMIYKSCWRFFSWTPKLCRLRWLKHFNPIVSHYKLNYFCSLLDRWALNISADTKNKFGIRWINYCIKIFGKQPQSAVDFIIKSELLVTFFGTFPLDLSFESIENFLVERLNAWFYFFSVRNVKKLAIGAAGKMRKLYKLKWNFPVKCNLKLIFPSFVLDFFPLLLHNSILISRRCFSSEKVFHE